MVNKSEDILRIENIDRLYELEGDYDIDFNDDGYTGRPVENGTAYIVERVLLDSSNSGYGSILELNNGLFAWQAGYDVYNQGDELDDYYRSIEGFEFGDVTLEQVVLSDWDDDGPVFYFFNGDYLFFTINNFNSFIRCQF